MDFGEQDTQRMLMLYIHDHMRKNNMHEAAKIFAQESNLQLTPVIDAPQGFLAEWWEVFWNKYFSIYSNIPGCEEISRDSSTLDMSFVQPTPGCSEEMSAGSMLQNISPSFTSVSAMRQQLVGNTSHCKEKDSLMEPSPSLLVPTPGIDRQWFEKSMPNVSSTISHQQQEASTQSSLLVAGVASHQNSEGRSSSQMEPTLQVPAGLNSLSTGSRNLSAGAFDFFKYYFRD